jgi:hypothetical protein
MRYIFKSSISRFGSILTPHIIEIDDNFVVYRKRNKSLINVDSISVPISKIAAIELNTSLIGTDIIIRSFGSGEIRAKNFTLGDAKKIKELIESRM